MSDCQSQFPEEIITNVLRRLPVKVLGACVCVCKPWRDIIKSPSFLKARLRNSVGVKTDMPAYPSPSLLLLRLCPETKESYALLHVTAGTTTAVTRDSSSQPPLPRSISPPPLTPISPNIYLRVVTSCAGAVLLGDDAMLITSTYALWNPTTHRLVRLRQPHVRRDTHGNYDASVGLAYDHTTGDFKVLRVVHFLKPNDPSGRPHPEPNNIEVFSLKARTWRDITAVGPARYSATHHAPQALANGFLHYVGTIQTGRVLVNVVLAFHISSEEFRKISLPGPLTNDDSCSNELFAYDGPAAVARSDGGSAPAIGLLHHDSIVPMGWDVWVLREHGVSSSRIFLARILDGDISDAPSRAFTTDLDDIIALMNNPIPFPIAFSQCLLVVELPYDRVVALDLDAYV